MDEDETVDGLDPLLDLGAAQIQRAQSSAVLASPGLVDALDLIDARKYGVGVQPTFQFGDLRQLVRITS